MAEILEKNDFVELEYTGKAKNGEIFDTNIPEEAKKINLDIKTRPLVICLSQNMILPSIDEFLIGKEAGKNYVLELSPEKAFGRRQKELVKVMPLSVFSSQKTAPQPGMLFVFDDLLGKVTSVSGGRITVDFNNPLAGKEIIYELKTKRKIKEEEEKAEALVLFFFQRKLKFEIKDKKLIIEAENSAFIELFKEKFREILGLELEAKEIKEQQEKKETARPI